MKFVNEDAYRLARDYMSSREGKASSAGYFARFIETYELYDKWLKSDDPANAAKEHKSGVVTKGIFD